MQAKKQASGGVRCHQPPAVLSALWGMPQCILLTGESQIFVTELSACWHLITVDSSQAVTAGDLMSLRVNAVSSLPLLVLPASLSAVKPASGSLAELRIVGLSIYTR